MTYLYYKRRTGKLTPLTPSFNASAPRSHHADKHCKTIANVLILSRFVEKPAVQQSYREPVNIPVCTVRAGTVRTRPRRQSRFHVQDISTLVDSRTYTCASRCDCGSSVHHACFCCCNRRKYLYFVVRHYVNGQPPLTDSHICSVPE